MVMIFVMEAADLLPQSGAQDRRCSLGPAVWLSRSFWMRVHERCWALRVEVCALFNSEGAVFHVPCLSLRASSLAFP